MKKFLLNTLTALILISSLSSCATVFGGRITEAQRTRPAVGEPSRAIRPVALIFDVVLFWPGLVIDFVTGAIYRPEGNGVKKPVLPAPVAPVTPPAPATPPVAEVEKTTTHTI